MDAKPTQLIDYFDGKKQNLIPLFQRPYKWDRDRWQDFWRDLDACVRADDRRTHFLGAVVSTPPGAPIGVARQLIIDGQQRITTLALLLAAVRDAAEGPLRDEVQMLLVNPHRTGRERLKLVPTQADHEPYRKLVEDSEADPQTRIGRGYRYFRDRIDQATGGDQEALRHLFERAEAALQVVAIWLAPEDDPYLIFESLNDRGESLTEADLVRNTALMRFEHDGADGGTQRDVYDTLWQPLERVVGGPDGDERNLSKFFRHYAMTAGEDIRKAGTYTAVKRRFDEVEDRGGSSAVKAELSRVLRLGKDYARFLNPAAEPDAARRSALRTVRDVESTVTYPLLLALYDALHEGRIGEAELTAALGWVESFVVRRLVCGIPTNALRRLFILWCKVLTAADSEPAAALKAAMLAGEKGSRWPTDRDFKEAFVTQTQYGRRSDRVVLRRLEEASAHKEPAATERTTIEHVLPQTLSPDWRAALGENADERHAEYVDRFGNLTLTGYNSELGNRSFADKRAQFSESNIRLNAEIAAAETWGPAEIDARGTLLADRAAAIWPRPDGPSTPPAAEDVLLLCRGPDAEGRGYLAEDGFVVLAGSTGRAKPVASAADSIESLRTPLWDAGVLEQVGTTRVRFKSDHLFDTPSGAACVVLGRTSNGWEDWKSEAGVTLNKLSGRTN